MKTPGPTVQWIVQQNLTNLNDLEGLRTACANIQVPCIGVDIIPFSKQLPDFPVTPCNIYYGSITFNNLVYENPATKSGLFFDPVAFSMKNYIAQWGRYMLNFEASLTTFPELLQQTFENDKLLFIRPDNDDKSFAGEVKMYGEIAEWYQKLLAIQDANLTASTSIVVSEPYNIKYEWRLWIVSGHVIAASKYREYFKLSKERGCPKEVIEFAEARCDEYTPHDVFVMDICLCGDEYYIVECGCMNGAGFYSADINSIVTHVTDYFQQACSTLS
ncbi:MAG: ATP-grasp domain-containing protein [Chitinophagaceae bacterium]